MKQFFKSLFGASSKEVNGVIVLVVLFLLSMAYPTIHRVFSNEVQLASDEDAQLLDSLIALLDRPDPIVVAESEKFNFDPNVASEDELLRLGFGERAAGQIINYREKGGRFFIKNDLLRIYSIDSSLVRSLSSYIDLPKEIEPVEAPQFVEQIETVSQPMPVKPVVAPEAIEKFNLNLADTAMLQTISGIGSVLSNRIVSFRDKLGGFVKTDQLFEVYNLDSSSVEKLLKVAYLSETFEVNKIMINSVSEEALSRHPYISKKQSKLIIAYRNQHGKFSSANDLLKVYLINDSDINRLAPYLQFD